MRHLPQPNIGHRELFIRCARQTAAQNARQSLLAMVDRIVAAGERYNTAAGANEFYAVASIQMDDNEKNIIQELYDRRMASVSGSGRSSYDLIRASSAICPYCSFGEVCEIDHFLPKKAFPDLNVLPINLLPICHHCNHLKLDAKPLNEEQTLLHPYFDVLPHTQRWLFATLTIEFEGPVLNYFVQLDEATHGLLSRRLQFHFNQLRLSSRFSVRSATVLAELEADIEMHLERLGADGITDHFNSMALRSFKLHGNTFEGAAYFAAAQSLQYCQGAWRN
ncbi:MAG: hypothetical protein CTY31_12520 [Hyphomicrobium sp.]|nr:MAG: hypothetical protein CTY39_09390 [Hyphomicrobium sp.]PPC98583.1 MAG: hypothetical protein CTY31_12520 [Hyphomicrobium sp.]